MFPKVVSDSWEDDRVLKGNIEVFTREVLIWNKDVFGNIFHRKNRTEARLRGIQASLADGHSEYLLNLEEVLRKEYLEILQQEEEFWSVKSRLNWLIQGDRNTKFFHSSALIRRKRNRIASLKDSQGNWVHDEEEVASLLREGFYELFSTSAVCVQRDLWTIPSWSCFLNEEEADGLTNGVSLSEIKAALWCLKPLKAPGPDGLHAGFFQSFWNTVGSSVVEEVTRAFRDSTIPPHLNETLITLIPKCPGADCLNSFRPISLCHSVYKVVAKIIVNRLRPLLPKLISPLQTAFVPGRMGLDNMIITQEIIHSMSLKKGKVGCMAIKINLEKAYDRLEWHFLRDVLNLFRLPRCLMDLIMSCVSSSSISVLFNGGKLEPFLPSRGIRQGDPLSPYLFIMCMEVLGFFINGKCEEKLWDPVKASRNGPAFSHLFFADDLVIFAKADSKNCTNIRETLDSFCALSGLKINLRKSKVYFSPNIDLEQCSVLSEVLGFSSTPNLGKYLGFPLKHSGATSQDFNFIIERVQNKLQGWKSKLLSMAGRVVLSQAVISATPAYVMQGCILPQRVINSIDKINRNFVWGTTDEVKKMHMVSWRKITKPKARGGLGVHDAKGRNLTLVAKLCWRMEHSTNSKWAEVLRKKYQASSIRKSKAKSRVWTAVLKGKEVCNAGSKWTIGSNSCLSFWFDKWMGAGTVRELVEGPLNLGEEFLTIKDLTEDGGWNLDSLSFNFPTAVSRDILSTPLRRFAVREDQRSWISSLSGSFDPKNAYLIAVGDDPMVPDFRGRWLWKLNTLPKIHIFLWKCLHHSLPVKSILTQRGIEGLGGCAICPAAEETIIHVLRDCPIASRFWRMSGCLSPLEKSFSVDLESWLCLNAKSNLVTRGKEYPWSSFFLFGIWRLWIQRNNKAFKQQAVNPTLLQYVEMQVREFMNCVSDPEKEKGTFEKEVRWSKPPLGWHKLNTDGSFVGAHGLAGCGGVIRDSEGCWIEGFAMSINTTSSISAELWALREGLRLCINAHLRSVEIEIDASAVISFLASNTNTNGDPSALIDDCRDLLRQLPHVKLSHVFREANTCADALARLGSAATGLNSHFVSPPPCVIPLLMADTLGMYRLRLCNVSPDVFGS